MRKKWLVDWRTREFWFVARLINSCSFDLSIKSLATTSAPNTSAGEKLTLELGPTSRYNISSSGQYAWPQKCIGSEGERFTIAEWIANIIAWTTADSYFFCLSPWMLRIKFPEVQPKQPQSFVDVSCYYDYESTQKNAIIDLSETNRDTRCHDQMYGFGSSWSLTISKKNLVATCCVRAFVRVLPRIWSYDWQTYFDTSWLG